MPGTIGPHSAGLLGQNLVTGDGTHMYHASLPMAVAHTTAQREELEARGYQEEYIPQEYPKVLSLETKPGVFRHVTVKNADEEAVLRGREAVLDSNHPDVVDRVPQTTKEVIHAASNIPAAPVEEDEN